MPLELQLPSQELVNQISQVAEDLGFTRFGVSNIDLSLAEQQLLDWLSKGFHGEMSYMQRHGSRRSRPAELVDNTASVISVGMNYLPEPQTVALAMLEKSDHAYISRYALGRDYHKLIRQRLKKLAIEAQNLVGPFGYRVFTDSAPVLEKPIAALAGIGWVGKHSNILNREQGSWFFLGEIYIDIALPPSQGVDHHCGDCRFCIDICPTQAIIAPYIVDARKCISYLTIEYHGIIPEEFRVPMGNRIYGCDDCQLTCPWNRFATQTEEKDFAPRHSLDAITLLELFSWSETHFLDRFQGSAIRRIGYSSWMRNISIALGNAPFSKDVIQALQDKKNSMNELVKIHIDWAINQQLRHNHH